MVRARESVGGRWLSLVSLLMGCEDGPAVRPEPTPRTMATAAAVAPIPSVTASASAPPPKGPPKACPKDMALVEGDACPLVEQRCLERPRLPGGGFEQCQRYAPSKCLSKERRPMRFCMDRYEWPNEEGALPRTLTSWPEAVAMCESEGKRLCTMDEWQFACEGEAMKPHVYGFERDPEICNFDRPYRKRTFNYARWDACMKDPACKAEYDRLDQRRPAGSMPRCVSEHGVYDLNGNANEWVVRTDQTSPRRSGLKGGWWGPVRNRCRPMTTFHLEGDYGYEVGFRCCRDAVSPP